jgi:predicted MFS family arabinose efflux permease
MTSTRQNAIRFIVAIGIVSLFADFCYEGARSITGPYLAQLGATAAIVGLVSGFGELVGYSLRLASGRWADRTRAYWPLVIAGAIVNLGAVPLLALAGRWQTAALLIIAERAGKGLRTPPRDVLLSAAASSTGRGWGFTLHEALDETGALLGPLAVAAVLRSTGRYQSAFLMLAFPFAAALAALLAARLWFPRPQDFEPPSLRPGNGAEPRVFWFYTAAGALLAFGVLDFPLIAFHLATTHILAAAAIPLLFAAANGTDALLLPAFGKAWDRFPTPTLLTGILACASSAPLVLLGGQAAAIAGMLCWGAGLGAHQSLIRAGISHAVPVERRGKAFGIYNTIYGLAWFAGSATAGLLYQAHRPAVAAMCSIAQLAAVPLLLYPSRRVD